MSDLVLNLRIRANADGTAQVLGQTSDGIRRVSTESGNASNALRGMDSAASGLIRTIAPLIGIYELISFGKKVVDDTATVQDLDTRLHSLTKTAGDYAQTVGYINKVAEEQHKKLNDLTDSYAKLRVLENSGIITGRQTKGLYEGLNNAASELGAGNDQLKQSFFGLAQGLASGVLHAEELNQVTEPMPGLMNSLDKALGQGAGGFRRLTNDGKITSEMFATTLVEALHDFDGAAAATANNINAKTTDISNSWTRLVTSFEPSTSAIFNPVADSAKNAIDATREFNEVAMTVGETNVSASSLAQGAWAVTTDAISTGWGILKAAGLGAATDTVSGWIASGDQMKSNVKFVVNDMIGLFVGLGHSVGIIFGALATNVSNTLDNAIAKASAAAGDVARMGVGDFSFSSSKAVVDKPLVNGWADMAAQFKTDMSTDWIGTYVASVEVAAVAAQKLTDEQKKAGAEAEQAKAKSLQLAGAHNAVGSAAGLSAEATKKAAAEAKKHADAIAKEIESLNDQHLKLTLSERDYELSKLAALGMSDAVKASSIAIWDSIQAIEAQKKGIDAGTSAMDAEIERYNKLTQSANEYKYSQLLLAGVSPGKAVGIVAQSSVNDDIEKRQKSIDDARSSLENYNKTIADTSAKTSDLGSVTSAVFDGALGGVNTLAGAFDNMVNSIDKSTAALEVNQKAKVDIDKFKPATDNGLEQYLKEVKLKQDALSKNAKDELRYNSEIVNEKLAGTRQIAGAISSMLKQGATEQRAAHAIEMGLAGAQIAMQVLKIAGIGAEAATETASVIPVVAATELKTAAKFGETWATEQQLFAISTVLAAETASTAPSVASSTLKGEAKAAEAVATQASAGPGIGFALMAAMAAAMAAIGFMGGKSSVATMGPQGMSADTGTVLGDSSAKSQSIDKTYQLLKDIHADEYATLRSIDKGIANLHSGITDVITRLFQAGGLSSVATPESAQLATGLSTDGITGLIFQTQLLATTTRKALEFANIATSFIGMDIDPISNFLVNGLFGGKQESNVTAQGISTNATSLSDIMAGGDLSAQQFAQIETKTDGGWFGKDKFSFSTQYSALDDATQQAVNDIFKSMGDTMLGLADALGGDLSDKVKNYIIPALSVDLKGLDGEAAAKKLNGVISTALDTMSTSVFGDVLENYQQLGEGMLETAVRIVSEVAVVEDALSKSGLSISGDAIAISDGLAQAAGGLQEFQKQFDNYYQKFYSDAERNVFLQKGLTAQLSDVNSVLPETRDGYRALIESLDINNGADQERYSLLIKLSEAADTYYSVLEDEQNKYNELSIRLLETQGKAAEALNEKRKLEIASLDETSAALMSLIYTTEDNIKYASLSIQLLEKQGYSYAALTEKRKFELESLDATAAAIQEQIYVTEDNIKSASLSIQLLEKQGYSYAALNEKRQFEIQSLDETSAAIMSQIYAAEDSAKSMSLYIKSMEVQGMATEALAEKRKIELNALSETDKAIQESIWAVEDYTAALKKESDAKKALITAGYDGVSAAMTEMQQSFDAAKKTISDQYKADSDALRDNLDTALASYETQKTAATDLLSTLTALSGNLKSALQSTVVESARLNSIRRSAAQDVLQSALTSARAGNSLANYPGLEAALSDIAKPSEDFYSTLFDYERDQGRTAGVLDELSSYTDAQVSVAQQTLDAIVSASDQAKSDYDAQYKLLTDTYNSNIAYYDSLLDWFQKGVDVLNGIDIWTLSVSDAITGATDAILALAKTAGYEGSYAPNTYSSAAGASISGSTATGLSGIGYNTDAVKQFVSDSVYGGDFQTLYDWAKNEGFSATSLDYLMGWTSGAMNLEAASHGLPSFDVGINQVPFDMLALIHKDERIFPAADNRELMMRLSEPVGNGNNNSEVAAEIRLLRQDNRVQAQEILALQSRIVKQLEQWEGDGLPETRDVSV